MNPTHTSKAFIGYLEKTGRDGNIFKEAKKDFRLNKIELQIIEAWNLLKTTDFEKIISITEKSSQDQLIQSQLMLVRAVALHNCGRMLESIPLFEQSIVLMKRYDLRRMKFIAFFNLFNACQNLKWDHRLASILNDWLMIPAVDFNEAIAIKRCQLRLLFSSNEMKKAEEIIAWLEGHIEEMSELNRLNFHIDLFDFYAKKSDFQSCSNILSRIKKMRSYHYGAHFKYLKALVDYHLSGKPFYIYERDFSENKQLFYELSVLKFLEEQDERHATLFWSKLREIDPENYKINFQCKVKDSLFSLALKNLLLPFSKPVLNKLSKKGLTKEELVKELFLHHDELEKNKLYELVWGHVAESKADLAKLQLIIFRLNKKGDVQIKYRKGCYHLIKIEKKAS